MDMNIERGKMYTLNLKFIYLSELRKTAGGTNGVHIYLSINEERHFSSLCMQ